MLWDNPEGMITEHTRFLKAISGSPFAESFALGVFYTIGPLLNSAVIECIVEGRKDKNDPLKNVAKVCRGTGSHENPIVGALGNGFWDLLAAYLIGVVFMMRRSIRPKRLIEAVTVALDQHHDKRIAMSLLHGIPDMGEDQESFFRTIDAELQPNTGEPDAKRSRPATGEAPVAPPAMVDEPGLMQLDPEALQHVAQGGSPVGDDLDRDIARFQVSCAEKKTHWVTIGREISLVANLFRVKTDSRDSTLKNITMYGYDVSAVNLASKDAKPFRGNHPDLRLAVREAAKRVTDEGDKEHLDIFECRHPVLIGPNLYLPFDLTTKGIVSGQKLRVELETPGGRTRSFALTMTPIGKTEMRHLEKLENANLRRLQAGDELPREALGAISIIESIVKQYPMLRYVSLNNAHRAFFDPTTAVDLSAGDVLEVMMGHFTACRNTEAGLMINVDYAATTFTKEQPLLYWLMSKLRMKKRQGQYDPKDLELRLLKDAPMRDEAERLLKKAKLKCKRDLGSAFQRLRREHRIDGLDTLSAEEATFDAMIKNEEGEDETKKFSVAEWNERTFGKEVGWDCGEKGHYCREWGKRPEGKTLYFPGLPCAIEKKGNVLIRLPLEQLWVKRKAYNLSRGEATPEQVQTMLEVSTKNPQEGIKEILRIRDDLVGDRAGHRDDKESGHALDQADVKVSTRMQSVNGRVLPAPTIVFGDGRKEPKAGTGSFQ